MGNRDEKRTRRRSRAGALIAAHLDWLDGYPLDDPDGAVRRWQTVPRDGRAPRILELNGRARSRALRTARTLMREERDVLERMLPDADRWLRAIELAVRGEEPWSLYSGRDASFVRGERDAFAWLCAARGEVELVRAWAEHRETFEEVTERIDLPFALQLCRLTAQLRPGVIFPLLRTFRDPLTYEVSTKHPPKEWKRTPPTPIPCGPSSIVEPLMRLVREALAEPTRASAICRLWSVVEPSFILREWNAFWVRLERVRASVDRELRLAFEQKRACKVAGQLKSIMDGAPTPATLEPVIDDVLRMARRPSIATAAARALRAAMIPTSSPIASRVTAQTRAAHRPTRSRARWDRCTSALHRWSRNDWSDEVARMVFRAVEADPFDLELLSALERNADPRLLRILIEARREIEPAKLDLVVLEDLARAGATAIEAARLHDVVEGAPFDAIQAAFRLTRDVDTIRDILPRIAERPFSDIRALACLPDGNEHFHPEHLKAWILLARRVIGLDPTMVQALRPTPIESRRDWIRAYPAQLWSALSRFARVEPNAEARAAALLSPDIRSDADIRRELSFLPPSAIERRRALLDRLANPRWPSGPRLDRLSHRIELAADLTFVERWTTSVESHLRGSASLDVELEMIAALRTLDRPIRKLAERVLSEGDLRDAPGNAAYLVRMRKLGIDMSPWLAGIGVQHREGWALALENDPVGVLEMGGHFSTCLSPGACNFFAAVVNAADVNKRVLYARDAAGIAARVLLALDAQGELVRYETFQRNRQDAIDGAITTFIEDLLERMGTRYAAKPDLIELLTTDRWYCDAPLPPPVDELATLLADAPVDDVVAHLARSIELSTSNLVALIERLGTHPAKAEPVLRGLVLQRRDDLPDASLRTAASIAEGRGERALAEALVADRATRLLWTRYRMLDVFIARMLLEQDPRELLRGLSRRRRRAWQRETRPVVLLYAGRALAKLERPKKARRVFELAVARGSNAARRALDELDFSGDGHCFSGDGHCFSGDGH